MLQLEGSDLLLWQHELWLFGGSLLSGSLLLTMMKNLDRSKVRSVLELGERNYDRVWEE